jgi:hypothetical protein
MTNIKKSVVFEGKDQGLSSAMQKLKLQAEQMTSSVLSNYAKTAKSSKELVESMNKEIETTRRRSELTAQDKRFEIADKYAKKLEEIDRRERQYFENSRNRRMSPEQRAEFEQKGEKRFSEQRSAADLVRKDELETVKKGLEEQKTTNELLREMIDQNKVKWEQEVRDDKQSVQREIKSGLKNFEALPPDQQAKLIYQQSLVGEKHPEEKKRSVMADILGAGLIRDLGSIVAQMPRARDAYDLVGGASQITGGLVGAGIGTVAEALTAGQIEYATIGAEIGKQAGAVAGQAVMRHVEEREKLDQSSLRLRGLTGRGYTGGSLSNLGVSMAEAASIEEQLFKSMGRRRGSAADILDPELQYSLDRGSLMDRARTTRLTGGSFRGEMSNLFGVAGQSGIDRVLFQDVLNTQNQLIKTFSETGGKVDPKSAMALMLELNKFGGSFAIGDPRQMNMISGLQSGISSPNEFGRAMNFSIMRNMGKDNLLDMLELEEQGLRTKEGRELLGQTIKSYNEMFGNDEDLTVMALKQRFPNIPYSELRKLAKGQDIGSLDEGGLTATAKLSGESNVSTRTVMQAEVTDAFANGAIEGMKRVKDQFKDLIAEAFEEAITEAKGYFESQGLNKKEAKRFGRNLGMSLIPGLGFWGALDMSLQVGSWISNRNFGKSND